MQLTYLIGQPGSGKSTLMRAATGPGRALRVDRLPIVDHEPERVSELGRVRDTFSGTDALGMAVLPVAVKTLPVLAAMGRDVIAEGDRLATPKFWTAAEGQGWTVTVVLLDTPDAECARRRAARGSSQSEAWVRGRVTKTENLRPRADVVLDGAETVAALVAALRAVEPFARFF